MYTCFRNSPRQFSWLVILSTFIALIAGCDDKDESEKAPGASAETELGRPLSDMELSVSLRTKDSGFPGAAVVESTTEQMRVEGVPVAKLDRGMVVKEDQSNGVITKLTDKLRGRSAVAMRLQANVTYETMALILNTAKQAGIHNAALQVRKTGASPETGWLALPNFVMASKADDLPQIPGTTERSWNDFTDHWEEVYRACRAAQSGSCAYVNKNFATGGTLRMELMASGRGINVNFFRRGLTPKQEQEEEEKLKAQLNAKKEDFLQGRITEEEMIEALLLGDPSTYALFQFRYQEALGTPSPIETTMAPMCEGIKCAVVITADPITLVTRVVSLLGAAFPDGKPAPALAFEMPWTKKAPPEDLAKFIEDQKAKEMQH